MGADAFLYAYSGIDEAEFPKKRDRLANKYNKG